MNNKSQRQPEFTDTLTLRNKYRTAISVSIVLALANLMIIFLISKQIIATSDSKTFAATSDGRVIAINTK